MGFTFLKDTFDGANGTNLANHTPEIGGPWHRITGNATLVGNEAVFPSNAAYSIPLQGLSGKLSLGFNLGNISAGHLSVYVNKDDTGNQYLGAEINGSGEMYVNGYDDPAGQPTTCEWDKIVDSSGNHTLVMQFGPAENTVLLDGQKVYQGSRAWPGNEGITLLQIGTNGLTGGNVSLQNVVWSK